MMTLRSHDQYNTTVYDVHDRYMALAVTEGGAHECFECGPKRMEKQTNRQDYESFSGEEVQTAGK